MGKIIIEQSIFCDTYESAKAISKAFEKFKFKFYDLGKSSSVYAKRYIRKTSASKSYSYRVIIRYPIEYDGEFLDYGFLDARTQKKYPELIEKISIEDDYEIIDILHEYRCLEDYICRDIYYYKNFEAFFNDKLKKYMNKLYIACVIAFANVYKTDCFTIYYTENNINYTRGYFAHNFLNDIFIKDIYTSADRNPIKLSIVWKWFNKYHKYKKDRLTSTARPLTALTYTLNRSNFEKTFYAVMGLESIFTESEKGVRKQLKETIRTIFPFVLDEEIDLFYSKRSDFVHGNIIFPDYYENEKDHFHWSDTSRSAEKSTLLLIISLRELVKNDAIKIIKDNNDNIVYKKHELPY